MYPTGKINYRDFLHISDQVGSCPVNVQALTGFLILKNIELDHRQMKVWTNTVFNTFCKIYH